MKTYLRLVRRRVVAALRLGVHPSPITPVLDPPIEVPSEIVDLASGPFAARFPGLAARRRP